jgi:hypothetical protein
MMRRTMLLRAAAVLLICAVLAWVFYGNRLPSLEMRIKATAAKIPKWPDDNRIPNAYERDLVALAKEPASALDEAFRSLDVERSQVQAEGIGVRPSLLDKALYWLRLKRQPPPYHPMNDRIWLTGTLITILAFDCPPVSKRDYGTWYSLKSRLAVKFSDPSWKPSAATDRMLAEWPWSHEHGSWHLLSTDTNMWGSSDGEIAPRFEFYATRFGRRLLP